jgi:glycosyltransferase involved in cell wall biosynthesis
MSLINSSLVSVVIPMFNAEKYVGEAIESILAQTYKNIEIIVVDDGSTDGSKAIVDKYKVKLKYFYQANSGTCSNPRNRGVEYSSGEYITFFDADDIMLPRKIEKQVEFLNNNPRLNIVLTDYLNFNPLGDYETTHFAACKKLYKLLEGCPDDGGIIMEPITARKILALENFSSANSPMFRKELFKKHGFFDETLRASEDYELIYRLAMNNGVGIMKMVGFKRRMHESNMSKNLPNILEYKIKCRKKILEYETDKEIKKEIRKFISDQTIGLAEYCIGLNNKLALKKILESFILNPFGKLQGKVAFKTILNYVGLYR